jgi:four helix bundle protein
VGHSFKDLIVWQKARQLVVATYRVTRSFPRSETYGLTSQLQRAAVSVASNIAEGQGRLTRGEFIHFLGNARGSLVELQTQFILANDVDYITSQQLAQLEHLSGEVLGLLNRLIESLRRTSQAASGAAT